MTAGFGVRGSGFGVLVLGSAVTGAVLVAAPVFGQGRITNAKMETRSAAQGVEREVRAVAARGGASWIGYRVPMVAGPRQMCCDDSLGTGAAWPGTGAAAIDRAAPVPGIAPVPSPSSCCGMCRLESGGGVSMTTGDSQSLRGSRITLEPPTEFLVLARVENGAVARVHTFTPDCDVDTGGMPLVWLNDAKPDDSIAWLTTLVLSHAETAKDAKEDPALRSSRPLRESDIDRVAKSAMTAIALHDAPVADRALESFVAPSRPEWLRGETAFWLGSARGEPGARLLARMIANDPSDKVRDKVTFGLSVSKVPAALTTLIAAARDDRSTKVRGQALFWLAQKAGKEAMATIAGAIDNDPDTEVKKKAVFALSQMPKDEGVPRLIEVARTNRNPEVRKQAMFWLGQTRDPRAVKFFEDILLKK